MRVLLLALALAVTPAMAQERYPSKPLRLVVPFAPGGSTDIFARLVADRLAASLGQPVVVENRSGAAGNIGAEAVARSAPDGYTLLMATTGVMAINNAMYRNMTYEAAKDFEPVVFVASITNVLIVSPEFPAASVAELIALAKSQPGRLSFASSGAGSSTHMSAELFKSMSQTEILHIPYKGSGQALPDLMSGRVSMMFENMPGAVSHIKAGKVRALAVSWSGIAVPAGAPRAVVQRLNRDINAILASPEMRQKLAEQGADAIGGPPEAFGEHMRSEREKWSRLIHANNIVVN
jgi:tripartite-type tricarboxylate transporter receptor subunit TctC